MDALELADIPDYAPTTGIAEETYEEPIRDAEEVAPVVASAEVKQDDDNLDDMAGGERQDKSKKEVDTPPGEAPKPGESEKQKPAEQVQGSAADLAILQKACDALGITETDPVKQAEAIDAYTERQKSEREQNQQTTEQQRAAKVEDGWKADATKATHDRIIDKLRDAGWEVDKKTSPGKTIWDAETWADADEYVPDYAQQLIAAYNQEVESPEMAAFYNDNLGKVKAKYETAKTELDAVAAKYPHHDPAVAALMRDNNVPVAIFEEVARSIHEHTQRVTATTHSALTAAQAKVSDLEAQISGHDAALKAAIADERKRILSEMGRPNPASGGTGGPSPTETGAYQSQGIGSGIWDRIPVMK